MLTYVPSTTEVQAIDDFLRNRTKILQDLQHNLIVAHNRIKTLAHRHWREVNFEIGDYMYLKLLSTEVSGFSEFLEIVPLIF